MSLDSDEDDFVEYGQPLEQFDEETFPRKRATSVRDQVATDKHGRRRFHGAFTGGFSAGFFNSVGSLEGWTPSTFKSSRSDKAEAQSQKPEDFMDDEDMDEFGIAPKVLHATNDFNDSSLKRKKSHQLSDGPIPGAPVLRELLHAAKETVGIKLLMKMGWKPGQGIGPRVTKAEKKKMREEYGKIKRKVYGCSLPQEMSKTKQSNSDDDSSSTDDENVTFAPDDFQQALCKPKDNLFGLGFSGLDRRPVLATHINLFESVPLKMKEKKKRVFISGQAFGVGALEDEDEDIYSQEDMSQYDFSLESTSTASKQNSQQLSLKSLPKYSEDILEGFILGTNSETFKKYFPPPLLPVGFQPTHKPWKSRFEPLANDNRSEIKESKRHVITAVERAAILGDSISDNVNVGSKTAINEKSDRISTVSTKLEFSNFKPFVADPEKEKRYEQFLELLKKGQKERLSYYQPLTMTEWERERERVEFEKAAVLYQPLSAIMSDRFVSASQPDDLNAPLSSLIKSSEEEKDQKAAVKMKMFGQLTREESDWRPCSLLCKRFNVPELFPGSGESSNIKNKSSSSKFSVFSFLDASSVNKTLSLSSEQTDREDLPTSETPDIAINKTKESPTQERESEKETKDSELEFLDPPATVDLFKAIFLSSSDSDSESENEEKLVEVVAEVAKDVDSETKNSSEEKSTEEISLPKNTNRNLSPPRGVFANLDLDAVNTHRKDVREKDIVDDTEVTLNSEQQTQSSDMYGPVLPVVTVTSSSSSKVLPNVMALGNCEWVEKTNKGQDRKHRKHKKSSKHKKLKHKKKKH